MTFLITTNKIFHLPATFKIIYILRNFIKTEHNPSRFSNPDSQVTHGWVFFVITGPHHLSVPRKEMFYLTMHSTHFNYGHMASDIWLRTVITVRKETCCCHIGYSFRLTAMVLLYAPSHRQDITYHSLCGALAGTRNSSMGPPHEGSIRRPIAP